MPSITVYGATVTQFTFPDSQGTWASDTAAIGAPDGLSASNPLSTPLARTRQLKLRMDPMSLLPAGAQFLGIRMRVTRMQTRDTGSPSSSGIVDSETFFAQPYFTFINPLGAGGFDSGGPGLSSNPLQWQVASLETAEFGSATATWNLTAQQRVDVMAFFRGDDSKYVEVQIRPILFGSASTAYVDSVEVTFFYSEAAQSDWDDWEGGPAASAPGAPPDDTPAFNADGASPFGAAEGGGAMLKYYDNMKAVLVSFPRNGATTNNQSLWYFVGKGFTEDSRSWAQVMPFGVTDEETKIHAWDAAEGIIREIDVDAVYDDDGDNYLPNIDTGYVVGSESDSVCRWAYLSFVTSQSVRADCQVRSSDDTMVDSFSMDTDRDERVGVMGRRVKLYVYFTSQQFFRISEIVWNYTVNRGARPR